jgi:hypothetical protein
MYLYGFGLGYHSPGTRYPSLVHATLPFSSSLSTMALPIVSLSHYLTKPKLVYVGGLSDVDVCPSHTGGTRSTEVSVIPPFA